MGVILGCGCRYGNWKQIPCLTQVEDLPWQKREQWKWRQASWMVPRDDAAPFRDSPPSKTPSHSLALSWTSLHIPTSPLTALKNSPDNRFFYLLFLFFVSANGDSLTGATSSSHHGLSRLFILFWRKIIYCNIINNTKIVGCLIGCGGSGEWILHHSWKCRNVETSKGGKHNPGTNEHIFVLSNKK